MKKKAGLILLITILAILIIVWLPFKRTNENQKGEVSQVPTPASKNEIDLEWKDQAGFVFHYPQGLEIDKNEEDNKNYANLEFSVREKPGGLLILAYDSPYKGLEDWIKKDKNLADGKVIDTLLGGKEAKKIVLNHNGEEEIIVGTIDDEILFTIRVKLDKDGFWQKVFDKVTNSFEFYYPTVAPDSGKSVNDFSSDNESDVVEEEEIVE